MKNDDVKSKTWYRHPRRLFGFTEPTRASAPPGQGGTAWQFLKCLHEDDRGGIAVLLLMIVLAIVALLGMLWNNGEYATRRQNAQNGSDSVAQAAHMWVSRTCNLVTATNMLLCENLSAEAILDSVQPMENDMNGRLGQEQQTANKLLVGNTQGVPEQNIPDTEYFENLLSLGAWANNGQGSTLLNTSNTLAQQINTLLPVALAQLPPAQAAQVKLQITNALRRDQVALNWMQNTWVGGQAPAGGLPAAPNVNGQAGLQAIVNNWVETQVKGRLNAILAAIPNEQAYADEFSTQADTGLAALTPAQLQARRDAIFAYQQQIRGMTGDVIEEQRGKLSTFYKVDLTLATPNPGSTEGPARIDPPLQDAGDVASDPHVDSIRPKYPQAAIAAFGTDSPNMNIDPINVNSDDPTGFDGIWHPGVDESAPPPTTTVQGQTYQATFHVNGGNWGQLYCAPLARYFNNRVLRDLQGLMVPLTALDQVRAGVRAQVYPMPIDPLLPAMPANLPDPAPAAGFPATIPIPPTGLPTLPASRGLSAANLAAINALNAQIRTFNRQVTAYATQLQNLQTILDNEYTQMQNFVDPATQNFAANDWQNYVNASGVNLLRDFGQLKQFTVLKTYALQPIPDWAKPGMWNSAQQYIYNTVYNNDIAGMTPQVQRSLTQWLTTVYSQGLATQQGSPRAASQIRRQAQQVAQGMAPGIAQSIVQRGAQQISQEVADEWVTRMWPYEITPPQQTVPPVVGMGDDDRINYFTLLAGARTDGASTPQLMMNKLFKTSGAPIVTYSQGETFNWMEFNANYGAGDRYDQVSSYGWNMVGGSPAPWRLCSIGGWNWQPRLAFSDALGQAIQNNTEFGQYLNQAGVTSGNQNDLNKLNSH